MNGIKRRARERKSREAEISKRGQRTEKAVVKEMWKEQDIYFFRGVRDGTFDRCFVENVSSEIQLSVKLCLVG